MERTEEGQRRTKEEVIADLVALDYIAIMELIKEMSLWDFIKLKISKLSKEK